MKKNLHLINIAISALTINGGILFTVGSVVYLPSLSYINGNVGAILFIIGSTFFFICDILGAIVQPEFTPVKPFANIGALRALLIAIGNFSFIIGSIYFLPSQPAIVGDDIFTIASVFVWIPQILTCLGLYSNSRYTQTFYNKLQKVRRPIMYASISLFIACMMFFVGTVLFKNQDSETIGLYIEGVIFFIAGSAIFLGVSIMGAILRHQRGEQQYENQDLFYMQMNSFRP